MFFGPNRVSICITQVKSVGEPSESFGTPRFFLRTAFKSSEHRIFHPGWRKPSRREAHGGLQQRRRIRSIGRFRDVIAFHTPRALPQATCRAPSNSQRPPRCGRGGRPSAAGWTCDYWLRGDALESLSVGCRRTFLRLSFCANLLLSRFFSPGFRKKECRFTSLIMPSCWTCRLKRRSALSMDSPSKIRISAKMYLH